LHGALDLGWVDLDMDEPDDGHGVLLRCQDNAGRARLVWVYVALVTAIKFEGDRTLGTIPLVDQ
jgi:hypothetical protein